MRLRWPEHRRQPGRWRCPTTVIPQETPTPLLDIWVIILIAILGCLCCCCLLIVLAICLRRRRKKDDQKEKFSNINAVAGAREGVAPKPKKRKGETFLQKTRRKMGGGRPAAAPPASERGGSDGVAAFFASNDSCKVALSTKGSALSEKI